MSRRHTEPGVRRISLPARTAAAIIATMPCPRCDAARHESCRVTLGKRQGRRCGPHGERIQAWMDHDQPSGVSR